MFSYIILTHNFAQNFKTFIEEESNEDKASGATGIMMQP